MKLKWSIQVIDLPLKYTWKISRNATSLKCNVIVNIFANSVYYYGEAAPNIRYQETPSDLLQCFDAIHHKLETIDNVTELLILLEEKKVPSALSFAIESAFMHYQFQNSRAALIKHFRLDLVTEAPICYSIPIMEPADLPAFFSQHQLQRFKYIKLKIADHNAIELVKCLANITPQPLMIDANEAFASANDVLRFVDKISKFNIEFLEQPLPASFTDEYKKLKGKLPFYLMADESITRNPDFSFLCSAFDGINMKLMKAGSYTEAFDILSKAKKLNMKTMVGCMVETSLAISNALLFAPLADYLDLDSFLVLQNDPFKLISEQNGVIALTNPNVLC
ncbi:MAG: hypothetical protein RIQ89_182 [Bacteroidota bacterium]|jgi:L-Ala-D/L-Glu epimerase